MAARNACSAKPITTRAGNTVPIAAQPDNAPVIGEASPHIFNPLTLNVTPRITEANTVILDVDVDNGSPGQVELNGNRSINTQRVTTRVLVADQGTTVIGGINEAVTQFTEDRTPGLHKVPLIGRLFRRDSTTDDEGELLIFITPRIVRDGGAVK